MEWLLFYSLGVTINLVIQGAFSGYYSIEVEEYDLKSAVLWPLTTVGAIGYLLGYTIKYIKSKL